ncbi:MAG: hypothetical protein ACUVRS_06525 [Armatimonadota bacterium]
MYRKRGWITVLTSAIGLVGTVGQISLAQCNPDWSRALFTSQGLGSASYAYVNTLCVYNGELYAGGTFLTAGNKPASYIARWNGSSWRSVGIGPDGYVTCMTVYNGELYVGGHFTSVNGSPANFIARWNGTSWQSVGNGMNGPVLALCVHNGELYAGGAFTTADDSPALHIAKWNGSSWLPVGEGLDSGTFPYVFALGVHNGELYAGGGFQKAGDTTVNYIARWNGTSWQPVGNGMNNFVHALCVYQNELFAGGDFTSAGGTTAIRIAKWNGSSWQNVGSGMNQSVRAFLVYNGELYAAGAFTLAGGVPANRIARLTETGWQPLGEGIGDDYPVVYALCEYGDGLSSETALYAGGYFTTAGGYESLCIARWGCEDAITSIPRSKTSLDSRLVQLNAVSTAVFGSVFYVSETLYGRQFCGIRVELPNNSVSQGTSVSIEGRMRTNADGERYIEAWTAQTGEPETAKPVYLIAKNVGGGDFGFTGESGQQGTSDGVGLNTIGLLVRTCGRFTQIDENTFSLDDGSYTIKCVAQPGTILNPLWEYVAVTGIASCERHGEYIIPKILVQSVEEISYSEPM